jgi:hypothetical protein
MTLLSPGRPVQARARYMPDEAANRGSSRSLMDRCPVFLTRHVLVKAKANIAF